MPDISPLTYSKILPLQNRNLLYFLKSFIFTSAGVRRYNKNVENTT